MSSQLLNDVDNSFQLDFSYIEPRYAKKITSRNNIESCSYSEWRQMQPPKKFTCDYHSLVSARQIDFVRALLFGKTALKWDFKEHLTSGYIRERLGVRRRSSNQEIHITPEIVKSCVKYAQNYIYQNK